MPKLSTTEVKAILQAEKSDALGGMEATELASQRSKAMQYYLGDDTLDGDMNPPPDRSKAVSSDVADTVEGLMPSLIEIFASGDDVVEFEPVGIEDEEAAQQETDYINHVFWHRNDGFLTLYSFLKDGLLQKNGIVKVWWEETEEEQRETYTDLEDDAYALIVDDPEVEIVEHTQRAEPMPGAEEVAQAAIAQGMDPELVAAQMPMRTLHSVVVSASYKNGCARVEPVPPEEFGITRRARSPRIGAADYCYHEVRKTQSELIAQGYDESQIDTLPDAGADESEEGQARDTVDDGDDLAQAAVNRATRLISVTEHYAKLDYQRDGKAKLYKIVTAGAGDILEKDGKPDIEPVDVMPFAAATPIIMPHRFFGRSVADLVVDIQRIKTALLRSGLDNIYLANNQRIEVSESHAGDKTLDDLLTNRPGGIVRTKMPGGLTPITNTDITSSVFPALEYQDAVREWRTGVTRQGQGIDANALQKTATESSQLFSMAQARMRLIARIFAETGIKDLFLLLHATIRKHGTEKTDTVRLRNKWVTIDPRNWKTRNDMTVNVGVASGSKEQQMMFLMNLLGIQKEALAVPGLGLAKPGNVYNTLKKVVHLANLKSVEPYFTDPDAKGPDGKPLNQAEPPPDPKVEQAKAEMDLKQQKAVADHQLEQQKIAAKRDADAQQAVRDTELAKYKADREAEIARYKADKEIVLQREKMAGEMALKREQLQAEIALKRELALVSAAMPHAMPNGGAGQVNMGGEPG